MKKKKDRQDRVEPESGMPREQILNQVLMHVILELLIIMRENGLNPVGEFMGKRMEPFSPEDFEQVKDDYKCITHAIMKYTDRLKQEADKSW